MLEKLTYKLKTRILIIGGVVFFILIYQLAIKKTVASYNECKNLEQKLKDVNNAPGKMAELQKLNAQMDRLLGRNSGASDVQQSLLGIVTSYCHENETVLEEFPEPLISSDKNTSVETNVFTIEGGFNHLLQLVYLFEQHYKIGKIVSVYYKTKKDFAAKRSSLTATIYLQNIKQSDHEI